MLAMTRSLCLVPCVALLAACAMAPPADLPTALQAPAGTSLVLEALASGVQIYTCVRKPDSATLAWDFKAPEAALLDRSGHRIGKHFAGPTWQASDGSAVVGEVKARDPGPTPTAIPWLLLSARSNSGAGVLAGTRYIQRIATVGGTAPGGGCSEATLASEIRVPYTATYLFYR